MLTYEGATRLPLLFEIVPPCLQYTRTERELEVRKWRLRLQILRYNIVPLVSKHTYRKYILFLYQAKEDHQSRYSSTTRHTHTHTRKKGEAEIGISGLLSSEERN